MIQNIKEIAGSHSDEEIYIMLKECNIDPNETTQKLILQDTFHEVRRKRDRKKEIKSLQYRIQHENIPLSEEKQIIREIKQLEGTRAEKRVIPDSGPNQFKFTSFVPVTLSCDHRVIDGAIGAE